MVHDVFKMRNGYQIPRIGFGTWQTPNNDVAAECVCEAIKCGYRMIDTAFVYRNEQGVGRGVKMALEETNLCREDIFITSKVWNTDRGYEETKKAFDVTLENLQLDYLDLYLIHWPAAAHQFDNWEEINIETWRAMTELYKEGKIRAIGVSNFRPHHLKALMKAEIQPMVNQIEFHPGQMQKDIVEFCRENGILVEAWSPLGTGRILKNETLGKIAARYGKSTAQLCIRWGMQHGIIPMPKTVTIPRIAQNFDVDDFNISDEDMNIIDSLPYCGGSGLDPDQVSVWPRPVDFVPNY